jgi:hypothetical protein
VVSDDVFDCAAAAQARVQVRLLEPLQAHGSNLRDSRMQKSLWESIDAAVRRPRFSEGVNIPGVEGGELPSDRGLEIRIV